jgi:ribonuclease HI
MEKLLLYTDGGARHNPGPAATGFLVKTENGQALRKGGRFLGVATNNEAEYRALIDGLRAAQEFAPDYLVCFLDSSLVVNQLNGKFKIKEARLRELVFVVKALEKNFKSIRYEYIPREENKEADAIVNQVLDEKTGSPQNTPLL